MNLKKIFSYSAVSSQARANFINLYFDIGWFGVLSGSTMNFLNVYATRIGATGFQIGLLGSVAAIVSLIFALPAGRLLGNRPTGKVVFWTAVMYRIGFLLIIPITWFLGEKIQIWSLIATNLLMGIPLVFVSVGFSNLFAESVPADWRAHVAGIRNATLAIMFMLTSLLSGYLLDSIVFPLNYQIVFFIGFLGAAMSTYHIFFIKPIQNNTPLNIPRQKTGDQTNNKQKWFTLIRFDIWKSPFRSTLLVMMFFHITQYLAVPVFPLYFIRALNLSDNNIGIGTALFYLTVLLVSTRLNFLVKRIGHKNVTGWGVIGLAMYPCLLALSTTVWQYYGVSIIGGLAWGLVGGANINYILEKCPPEDRPSHLAWYNIVLNASVLIGSLLGPVIAENIGLSIALIIYGIGRGIAGFAILKWG